MLGKQVALHSGYRGPRGPGDLIRRLVPVVAFWVAGATVFAQGQVSFANFSNSLISTNTVAGGPTTGYTSGPVGSYYYGLFWAPSTQTNVDASLTGWTFTGNYATNTASPGRLNGNYTIDPGVYIPPWGVGATLNFLIVGWSSNIGHDWPTAQAWYAQALLGANSTAGWFGVSSVARYVLIGGGPTPVPSIFSLGPYAIGGFSLDRMDPVPEPTALALLVPGLVGLLRLRGRK